MYLFQDRVLHVNIAAVLKCKGPSVESTSALRLKTSESLCFPEHFGDQSGALLPDSL